MTAPANFTEVLDRVSGKLQQGESPSAADIGLLFFSATNPESEWVCPMCLGSGEDPGDPERTCANCGGSGEFV